MRSWRPFSRKPSDRLGGERRPVVAADTKRQPELAKRTLEVRTHLLLVGFAEPLALDEKAAGAIADGQRMAAGAVAAGEVAFEVGTPYLVGLRARLQRAGAGRYSQPRTAWSNQSVAV